MRCAEGGMEPGIYKPWKRKNRQRNGKTGKSER